MIIAFGGLGGSGKTTQIKEIESFIKNNGLSFKTFILRDLLLWPKIVNSFKNNLRTINLKKEHIIKNDLPENKKNFLFKSLRAKYIVIRNIFYIFDFWRVYIFYFFIANKKYKFVLIDRYFYDFLAELFYPDENISFFKRVLLFLTPPPDIYFYFRVTPEIAFQRKKEFNIDILKIQLAIYENILIFTKNVTIKINGEQNKSIITDNILLFLNQLLKIRKKIDLEAFLLYQILVNNRVEILKDKVFIFDERKLFNLAALHKVLLNFLKKAIDTKITFENFPMDSINKIFQLAQANLIKKEKTLDLVNNIIKSNEINAVVIKSSDEIDIHSDIDILFKSKADYDIFKKNIKDFIGNEVIVSSSKVDLYLKNEYLSLDIHIGKKFLGADFFDENFAFDHPNIFSALILILHSFFETTLITLGDKIRFEFYLGNFSNLEKIINEAKKYRWLVFFNFWYSKISKEEIFFSNFPYKIPVLFLIKFRLFFYLRSNFHNILDDFIIFIKALRARRMKKIPFHEPWFKF
jgi:thymidylate kinase